MAWIESHQALGNHPKLLKLSRSMGWSKSDTLGRLHLFWHWCLDYAVDGQLVKHGPEIVADVFGVSDTDRDKFITALHDSEFVDSVPQFRVHDWWDYAGRFLQVRYKRTPKVWKEIKRLYGYSVSRTNNRTTTEQQPINNHKPNQPNLTNQPKPTNLNHTDVVEGVVAFDEFWKIFPRKDGKQDAKRAWEKLRPSRELFGLIVAAIDRQKASAQWTKDGGTFIPHAATWLNRRRWEDEGITGKLGETWEEQMRRWAEEGDEKDRLAAMEAGHDEK